VLSYQRCFFAIRDTRVCGPGSSDRNVSLSCVLLTMCDLLELQVTSKIRMYGRPYNESCDMWSVGCLLYMIICGYPPFQGKDHNDLFRKIRASDFTFHDKYWKKVSLAAKQLISGLLTVNFQNRITAKQACESSWITKVPDEALSNTCLVGSLREMKKFRAREKLRSAMGAVRWATTANFWVGGNISFSQHKSRRNANSVMGEGCDAGGAAELEVSPQGTEIQQDTFRDRYELVNKLRKGSFATVWECQHKVTKERFAVKVVRRAGLSTDDDEAVLNEVTIMQSLSRRGKYVVQLCDFYEEKEYFFIVMEYMAGGDVFDQIVERTSYTEKDARDLVKTLLKAVKCLHENGIAHRGKNDCCLLISALLCGSSPDCFLSCTMINFQMSSPKICCFRYVCMAVDPGAWALY
jgi:serine/threonine protein kinase